MTLTLQDLHDEMLSKIPEGASHLKDECPFCNSQISEPNGGEQVTTFTDEEVQAQIAQAVEEATGKLSKELEDLKATQTVAEWETKIAEARAELDAKVESVQAELDAKIIEVEAAKSAYDELVNLLETEKAREAEEAAVAARMDERVKAVAEAVPAFSEDYLTENAERWSKMDDEAFDSLLADYKAVAEKAAVSPGLPSGGALFATRETATSTGGKTASAAREVIRLQFDGIDPRKVTR